MVKLLAAYAILCAFFYTESLAQYNVTEQTLGNSYTFIKDSDLYTVWLTYDSLSVNSTNPKFRRCTVSIIDRKRDSTYDRIQAKAFANGKRFVIWGTHSFNVHFRVNEISFDTEYTALLLNPRNCSYKSLELPAYSAEKTYFYGDIKVVPNANSLDVFHPGQKNCSPCRFDLDGKRIEQSYQLDISTSDIPSSPGNVHIQPFDRVDRKQGYFFASNFYNGSAVIEHLDENFKTLKRIYVDHPVHSVSIWPDKNNPLLSICYNEDKSLPKHLEVHCQQLDSNLQSNLSFRLPVSKDHYGFDARGLTHQIDQLGNMYVGLIDKAMIVDNSRMTDEEKYKITILLRYFVYDKTGKLLESYDFDKLKSDIIIYDTAESIRFHSHLVPGEKFCLFDEEKNTTYGITHQIIRCFNIAKQTCHCEPLK